MNQTPESHLSQIAAGARMLECDHGVRRPATCVECEMDKVEIIRPSAINCSHGIPINLRCGACEADAVETGIPASGIDATLAERGSRYGDFTKHARITQAIKQAMADSPNWPTLAPDQRECLEMLAHKIGRMLNGDPDYDDNAIDIVGYSTLMLRAMQERNLNAKKVENAQVAEPHKH